MSATATCPYCKAPYVEVDNRCAECKALFPWAQQSDVLKEELKSREVNRGRATLTLIEEVFDAARGGKPVSIAALKGFAFAWIFPRTMIVVGSILGGLLLAVQTAILYQQTGLMRQQSGAAMLAESTQLRERLSIHYKLTLWNTEIHRAVTLGFGTRCSDQCKQLALFEVLDGKAQQQEEAVQLMKALASYLRVIVAPVTKLDAQTWDLRKAAIEPFPNFEDKYLEPVATVCLADVEHVQGFRQATQGLMIQSAALDLAIAGGEGAKDRWSAIIRAGPSMESLGQKLGVAGGVPTVESERYTFGRLVSDVHSARVKVVVASFMQPAAAYLSLLPSSVRRRPSHVRG